MPPQNLSRSMQLMLSTIHSDDGGGDVQGLCWPGGCWAPRGGSPHLRDHGSVHSRIQPRSGDQSRESATVHQNHAGQQSGSAGLAYSGGDGSDAKSEWAGSESGWDDLIIPMSRVAWRALEAAKSPLLQTARYRCSHASWHVVYLLSLSPVPTRPIVRPRICRCGCGRLLAILIRRGSRAGALLPSKPRRQGLSAAQRRPSAHHTISARLSIATRHPRPRAGVISSSHRASPTTTCACRPR
jgi:hypothetical protein